jgi:hypothetical protein
MPKIVDDNGKLIGIAATLGDPTFAIMHINNQNVSVAVGRAGFAVLNDGKKASVYFLNADCSGQPYLLAEALIPETQLITNSPINYQSALMNVKYVSSGELIFPSTAPQLLRMSGVGAISSLTPITVSECYKSETNPFVARDMLVSIPAATHLSFTPPFKAQ